MKQELYISNYKADMSEEMATMLTFVIDDIKDFTAKQGNVSKKIVLPGTKQNDFIFNYFFDVNIRTQYSSSAPSVGTNFNAAVGVRSVLFSNYIQTFKGVVKLLKIINYGNGKHDYEVAIFGEFTNLLMKLGNKKIEDLPFNPLEQTYSLANIAGVTTTDATDFTDYVYPLIDYGTYSTNKKDWKYRTFRPAIKLKTYVQKIFEDAGISYNFPLLNTTRFGKFIIPYNRKDFTKASNVYFKGYEPDSFTDFVTSASTGIHDVTLTAINLGNYSLSGSQIINTGAASIINIKLNVDLDLLQTIPSSFFGDFQMYLIVKKNTTEIIRETVANGFYSVANLQYSLTQTYNIALPVATSDYITFSFEYYRLDDDLDLDCTINTFTVDFVGEIEEQITVNLGEGFYLKDVVPKNYLQVKLLSDIVKLFNLYIYEDPNVDNKVNIKPFIDFYNYNTSVPLDWSNKIDRSKTLSITPLGQLNARYYQFNYAKDSDYWNDLYFKRYNETYGSRTYDSEFEFAKETEKIELQFAPTPLVGYTGEDKVYSSIYKRNNNIEERTDSVIRLLQYDVVTGVSSFHIENDSGGHLITKTTYVYAGHLNNPDVPTNDINFGAPKELFFGLVTGLLNINQFNVYWSACMAEITDVNSKIMEAYIYLNEQDIYSLDFSRKIYIDGQYWRLNKILDYNANADDVCKVELINIINTSY